jgi:hypothetical protein
MLSRCWGQPRPAPYRTTYGIIYDAVLHLRFARRPDTEQTNELLTILGSPRLPVKDRLILGSDRQYTIFDAELNTDERKRVNMCFLIRRHPEMTRENCQSYWRTEHASLALNNMRHLGLSRYIQVHTMATRDVRFDDDFDGIVYAEKPSLTTFLREFFTWRAIRVNNIFVMDEMKFTFNTPVMLMQTHMSW